MNFRVLAGIGGRASLSRRSALLAGLALLSGVLAMLWSVTRLGAQQDAAEAAAGEAARCQALADRIAALRGGRVSPSAGLAGQAGPAGQELAGGVASDTANQEEWVRLISDAAADAGLDDRDLDRIEPQAPRRAAAGKGPAEQPTQMGIRRATLEQLVRLLHALSAPPGNACVRQLRLTLPGAGAGDANEWAADVTLTRPVPPEATGPAPAPANGEIVPAPPAPSPPNGDPKPKPSARYEQR